VLVSPAQPRVILFCSEKTIHEITRNGTNKTIRVFSWIVLPWGGNLS
jgi:hypothetical protein